MGTSEIRSACPGRAVRKLGLFGKILIAFWLTLAVLAAALTMVLGSFRSKDLTP